MTIPTVRIEYDGGSYASNTTFSTAGTDISSFRNSGPMMTPHSTLSFPGVGGGTGNTGVPYPQGEVHLRRSRRDDELFYPGRILPERRGSEGSDSAERSSPEPSLRPLDTAYRY